MVAQGSNLVRLHIGDSYLPPPYDIPIRQDFVETHPGFNRYTNTFGIEALREVLAEKLHSENRLNVLAENVMMTCGACNALNISFQSLIDPGEDVLLLTPCWPFFKGMIALAGGNAVEVPFYLELYREPELDMEALLENYLTEKTSLVVLNTPNNPSGKVLNKKQLQQVAEFVKKHQLWLVSDEAYDGMTFDEHRHISIGSFPEMFERTISVFTFSKVYMFSGLRLGYAVAEKSVLKELNRISVHQLYSPSTIAQQMMVEPVKTRRQWSEAFVKHALELRNLFVRELNISPQVPEGTYYFFFPITEYLNGREYWQVIDECLAKGVSVAPGKEFGTHYSEYVRICFTGEPPDRLKLAIERLNRVLQT